MPRKSFGVLQDGEEVPGNSTMLSPGANGPLVLVNVRRLSLARARLAFLNVGCVGLLLSLQPA
jgi:hypothetical protein